jgi:hypothetical protein
MDLALELPLELPLELALDALGCEKPERRKPRQKKQTGTIF